MCRKPSKILSSIIFVIGDFAFMIIQNYKKILRLHIEFIAFYLCSAWVLRRENTFCADILFFI